MSWPSEALSLWGIDGALDAPIVRENVVWRVESAEGAFALRRHRRNFRTSAELTSELDWMKMLARAGLSVPLPRATPDGALLAEIDGVQASLLTWLPGKPMGQSWEPLKLSDAVEVFARLGAEMARLHDVSDRWTPPPGFTRHAWDRDGLVGEAPVWGRFWEAPFLSDDERAMMVRLRDAGRAELKGLDDGLIHADLLRENVLVADGAISLIDFDDGGYGPRLFDVATALVKNVREPDYPALREALIGGYTAHRRLETEALPLILALRAATYLGWVADRMEERDAEQRARNNTRDALLLAARALDGG